MKLYITPLSPYARFARIVILEKHLESRVEIIHAQTRIAESPYYAINPSGRVPYLIRDDGIGMEGSGLICDYLDHLDDAPAFAVPDGAPGLELRRLEGLANSTLDGLTVWGRELRHRPEQERSPRIIEHERQRNLRLLDAWESEIASPPMTAALHMTQIILVCALQYAESQVLGREWRATHPRLSSWLDAIARRPSIEATAPGGS